MEDQAKIMDKIAKLLKLADNNPNEHEAALAAEKASALALEYGLTVAQVHGKDEAGYAQHDIFESAKYQLWIANICGSVARLNACKFFYSEGYTDEGKARCWYNVIGRPHNVEATKLMVAYLIETINRLNREGVKGEGMTQRERKIFRKAFKLGCSERIAMRLEERLLKNQQAKRPSASEGIPGTALVVADYYKAERENIEEFIEKKTNLEFTHRRAGRRLSVDSDAYGKGLAAGNSVSLDPQIEG